MVFGEVAEEMVGQDASRVNKKKKKKRINNFYIFFKKFEKLSENQKKEIIDSKVWSSRMKIIFSLNSKKIFRCHSIKIVEDTEFEVFILFFYFIFCI